MIEINNLNKSYHLNSKPFHVLKNINLTIPTGQIFGLVGKSGAGKSTLLRCINLLERPDRGEIFLNQINLTQLSLPRLRIVRRKIGMIFQHFNLLSSRNVFDNIALPLEIANVSSKKINDKVSHLLELVGLANKKTNFLHQLSGGQQQRVAIARALASDPDVLLCDEATSALDTEATTAILSLLKTIQSEFNLTLILITHQLDIVKRICDRVGVMHNGELIEVNQTISLLTQPQAAITQTLVNQAFHFDIQACDRKALIIKLIFIGNDDKPLISNLAKQFDIEINIRQALIEPIQKTIVGFTICEIKGSELALNQALQFIKTQNVKAEILKHASI